MKKFDVKQKQKGFTIIELVVVILLLGILTATALPRFMDVTDEAHNAVRDAVLGGLTTSSALFSAQWYAEGQPTIVTEYNSMRANSSGFAVGTADTTLSTNADCLTIFETFLQAGGRPSALVSVTASGSALIPANITGTTYAAGTDFVAHRGAGVTCQYPYIGQFKDAATSDIPVINYSAVDGTWTLSTL